MDFSELVIEAVKRDEEAEFLVLMREHHYFGVPYKIGESAFYAADLQGRWVALSSFYSAVLMETFVDPVRFKGTCYRAAN